MNEGSWTLTESKIDDLPVFVRFRDTVESFITSGKFDRYLRIVWECQDVDALGMPSAFEYERFGNFENNLCDALEADDHAVLVSTMTCNGLVQWLFYTQNIQESNRRINSMPQEKERYPIELTTQQDPNWDEYKKISESKRSKG